MIPLTGPGQNKKAPDVLWDVDLLTMSYPTQKPTILFLLLPITCVVARSIYGKPRNSPGSFDRIRVLAWEKCYQALADQLLSALRQATVAAGSVQDGFVLNWDSSERRSSELLTHQTQAQPPINKLGLYGVKISDTGPICQVICNITSWPYHLNCFGKQNPKTSSAKRNTDTTARPQDCFGNKAFALALNPHIGEYPQHETRASQETNDRVRKHESRNGQARVKKQLLGKSIMKVMISI